MAKPITISDGKGNRMQLVGDQWVPMAATVGTATPGVAMVDAKTLASLNSDAKQAGELGRQYQMVAPLVHRLKTGPIHGMVLRAAIPEPKGGFWDGLSAATIGTALRGLGFVSPQDVSDYQTLEGIKQKLVLEEQTRQKGVQTEGDAARIMLSTVDPTKAIPANDQVLQSGLMHVQRAVDRPSFYAGWAKKYGTLGATNEKGLGVEQAFQQQEQNQPTPTLPTDGGWKYGGKLP